MTHSTVLVIVREASCHEEAEAKAEALLEPYNENTQVEPYRSYFKESAGEFWATDMLIKEGLIQWPVTWEAVAKAYNEKYGLTDDRIQIDEAGLAYEMSTYNPQSKWDWYVLGGRWRGFFPPVVLSFGKLGRPGSFDNEPSHEGWVDLARKDEIDWEFLRRQAVIEAEESYSAFEAIVEALPEDQRGYRPWTEIFEQHGPEDVENARTEYHSQPLVKAMREARYWDSPEDFYYEKGGREAYVKNADDQAGATFAILDGEEWYERGDMGWFGVVKDEKDRGEWNAEFRAHLDALPDTAWLAVYDVHI